MTHMPVKVMLVDDHAVVRMGFRLLLEGAVDIKVIAEAESGEEAVRAYPDVRPDVVVMDISMPGIGGLEATRRLRSEPNLQAVDGHRLKNTFDRYLELSHRKKQLVREVILSKWAQRQKDRLLITAATRLNATFGAIEPSPQTEERNSIHSCSKAW